LVVAELLLGTTDEDAFAAVATSPVLFDDPHRLRLLEVSSDDGNCNGEEEEQRTAAGTTCTSNSILHFFFFFLFFFLASRLLRYRNQPSKLPPLLLLLLLLLLVDKSSRLSSSSFSSDDEEEDGVPIRSRDVRGRTASPPFPFSSSLSSRVGDTNRTSSRCRATTRGVPRTSYSTTRREIDDAPLDVAFVSVFRRFVPVVAAGVVPSRPR